MSTLSGLTSKGEKGKSKFQSLDINNLYKVCRGESSEKQQQKSSLQLKHGMQSLGKVPSARRAPVNLPSLKSEHSGNDTAVSLVPSGGAGWGKQDSNTPPTTTTPVTVNNTNVNTPVATNPQLNAHQPAAPLPVPTTIPPGNKHPPTPTAVSTDKSWSAVMSGPDLAHPPPYQSPQFQHEFPSLSAGDGAQPRTGTDTQYGPGPSLRPQTEGSWMQGGSRGATEGHSKGNLAPAVAPPQLSAQVGLPPGQSIPQYPVFAPSFMCRGNNYIANGHAGNTNVAGNAPANNVNGRHRAENRASRNADVDEVAHRPIIKEEDLNRMDDMRDMGWAANDDIDYNQKIAFSDDEGEKDPKREKHTYIVEKTDLAPEGEQKVWSSTRTVVSQDVRTKMRSSDEDEAIAQRRKQHSAEVALVVSRAKQRKEEEEKRYLETKMLAAKKLQELEEKIKTKREKENDEGQGTINPMSVPPQAITPSTIPVPDWEKEKDTRGKGEKPDSNDEKPNKNTSDFRQLTQIEPRNYPRKDTARSFDREREPRDQNGSSYVKFQNNLPPRFQKQQLRNNTNSSPQPPSFHQQHETRWMQSNQNANKQSPPATGRKPPREIDRDYNRGSSHRNNYSDTGYKSDNRHKDDDNDYRSYDGYDYKRDDEKWEREREKPEMKQESFEESTSSQSRQSSEEFHEKRDKYSREDKISERYDRPQRPDSRDSRASRDSRHSRESGKDSESKEYFTSWNTEVPFEEKRKDQLKEDRRQVPGPITKDRIEADDLKSERRNLTQLKRGLISEKKQDTKQDEKSKDDDAWDIRKSKDSIDAIKGWGNSGSSFSMTDSGINENVKVSDSKNENRNDDSDKKLDKSQYDMKDKDDKRNQSRMRSEGNRSQGWPSGSSTVFRNSWSKRGSSRGSRTGPPRSSSNKSAEWHGTDSEISADEMSQSAESIKDDKSRQMQRSPKTVRKLDKDEKNKEIKHEKLGDRKSDKQDGRKDYLPRGEPSRHGRGGGNFRGRGGGLSKRIDHYGPPPSRSPFSHSDEKDKRILEENAADLDEKSKSGNKWKDSIQGSKMDSKLDDKSDKAKAGRKVGDNRRGKSKSKDGKFEDDTTSENSDESASKDGKLRKASSKSSSLNRVPSSLQSRRSNPPPRLSNEKRSYLPPRNDVQAGKPSGGRIMSAKKDDNSICSAIADISLKSKDNVDEGEPIECDVEDKSSLQGDSDGFQEVKSKKNGKERQKPEEKVSIKTSKIEKDIKSDRKGKPLTQLSQQQIANIPPLMGTPVNPPPVMPQSTLKSTRLNKLPPRFVKQRENNRLQKQQMQQTICGDISDINKVSQNINMYGIKEASNVIATPISNAWEKPLSTHLRNNIEPESMLAVGIDNCKNLDQQAQSPNQMNSNDKVINKSNQDKAVLDGTSAPVNTIIFENTNFKSAPGPCVQRNSKTRPNNKMEDGCVESSVMSNFNKPIADVLNKNEKQTAESMMQINFNKEDGSDMKLDFIESEISYLTEDKTSKNLGLPRSMHAITNSNTTISPSTADALNMKIASVKKVWENMATVAEHGQDDNSSFPSSFGADPNSLDPSNAFSKGADTPDDNHEVYSPSPNQAASNNTTNVCKVKPTQQVAGSVGQTVLNANAHQSHTAMVGGPGLMGHPLSPPPMQPVIGAGVGLGQPPQQFTNQHISYQASLAGSTQYGVSAIPSPPTVLFNSSQPLQAQTAAGLYGPFQIDQSQVLGGQGRSQYSQYPSHYNLGQTASSPYSQSMYLQTAQAHPPTAQAPPDIYQNMNNYRLPANAPFGQNQQLNNPSTVLISSTSNTLMSATVKPSSQQISAIGTKASGVGQAYQQQSQTGQQLYMAYDPNMQANYLSGGVMQRGPAAPVQNNVVPALQPSSSFYSGSTGGQTGYFQQPGNSTIQSAGPMQQHQAGYGLQGNVFGTHNQSHTNAGMQNFNSHFLSAPMQLAAAMNAQQYRSSNLPNTAYMKGVGNQQMNDQSGRSQQLKSPSGQQEVLSSVFNPGQQIPSPKSRPSCKQLPPQPSPTAQHKYSMYQNPNQQSNQSQRYPPPIQRPVISYQSGLNAVQNNSNNQKHRPNQGNRTPQRSYYSSQGNTLSNQTDKNDDSKLNENSQSNATNASNTTTANLNKSAIGNSSQGTVNQTTDISKEKEESSVIKD